MTNAFYQSPEPTCMCNKCKVTKPFAEMVPRAGGGKNKNGVRPLCKVCRTAQHVISRLRAREQAVAEAQEKAETRRSDPRMTPPRTYNTSTTPWVPQDTTYYRNNGNKHVPSKGISA